MAVFVAVTVILIATAVVMSCVVTTRSSVYVEDFPKSQLTVDGVSGTLHGFEGSSLYPYSGTWNSVLANTTLTKCANQCLTDETCRAFTWYGTQNPSELANSCRFYTNNNVQSTVGFNVEMSPFFLGVEMIIGDELPLEQSSTYIKNGESFRSLRSDFSDSKIVTEYV